MFLAVFEDKCYCLWFLQVAAASVVLLLYSYYDNFQSILVNRVDPTSTNNVFLTKEFND